MKVETVLYGLLGGVAFAILIWGLCGLVSTANKNMKEGANIAYKVGVACKCGGIPYTHNPYSMKYQSRCWTKGWHEAKCE